MVYDKTYLVIPNKPEEEDDTLSHQVRKVPQPVRYLAVGDDTRDHRLCGPAFGLVFGKFRRGDEAGRIMEEELAQGGKDEEDARAGVRALASGLVSPEGNGECRSGACLAAVWYLGAFWAHTLFQWFCSAGVEQDERASLPTKVSFRSRHTLPSLPLS